MGMNGVGNDGNEGRNVDRMASRKGYPPGIRRIASKFLVGSLIEIHVQIYRAICCIEFAVYFSFG